jgi:hypothetical protein
MSSISHGPAEVVEAKKSRSLDLLPRELWASLAITVIWLAVLFTAIFGGDIVDASPGGNQSSVPSAVAVALFAVLATWAVARYGFSRGKSQDS